MANGVQINKIIWGGKRKCTKNTRLKTTGILRRVPHEFGLEFEKGAFMNKMNATISRMIYAMGIIFLLSITATSIAQSPDEIAMTIRSGSSKELAKYFENTIALDMDNPPADYSKNQAEQIFRDFFNKFPPQDFQIVHQGNPSDQIWFMIGDYFSKEAAFKVLVKGKQINGGMKIFSMEFNRE